MTDQSVFGDALDTIGHWLVRGTTVPEPSTYAALVSLGLVGIGIYWKRVRARQKTNTSP